MKNMGALAIGILLLISSILSAQEITGNLEGRILDPDGQPLAGVQVAVTGASLQGVREAKTDERGYFRLFSLPTGIFTLKVHHEAFLDVSLESVRVQLGRTNSLGEIRLRQKVLEAQEIVVTAERPAIDPTSTATGLNLVADTIEDLPGPRNYRNVMAILPGANQSYYGDEVNVAGATGSENAYFIDGIDVSDPYKRYNNTSLPYNFIKEIEIKTGGYEAEYRSSLGGLVNAVTYSGGNEFSGQIFGFFTNNNFSQSAVRAELEPGKGDLSQYDFGFSLGGPIIRDKLWFFGAYNPTVAREDVLVPGLDYYEDKLTQNIFAGKITWQPSSKANFVLTAIGDPAKHNSVGFRSAVSQALNPDPMLTKITQGGYSFLASGHYIFSEEFFLEASLAYITRRDRSNPATERGKDELVFLDIGAGDVVSGGHRGESYGDSQQTTISIKGTLVQGDHILKAGFEYRDNKLDSFTNDRILFGYGPNDFILQTFNESGTVHNRIPSLFAQDSWRIPDWVRWKTRPANCG
jgi:outer membrane receptor for ferrienterochelin and colicin